ncbi:LOW QUALITY PROTEIN: hypothetical protein RJ639_014863 [Escallonia herrerae]|uniref:BED-type domain-containing protein n=1 Tax=Escallonia herrerae TaxID=1293975 RepID=A0AA88VHA5_9ASTE|nr:LOW QUALITY PROTEIN: hypothetical protein RJ639_014863 [Escallonia herrerae]
MQVCIILKAVSDLEVDSYFVAVMAWVLQIMVMGYFVHVLDNVIDIVYVCYAIDKDKGEVISKRFMRGSAVWEAGSLRPREPLFGPFLNVPTSQNNRPMDLEAEQAREYGGPLGLDQDIENNRLVNTDVHNLVADMSSEEIELSSASSISNNSSRPGLSKSKGKAIIMSEPVGEAAIGEVEVNTMFKRRERKKTSPDFFIDVTLANGTKKVKCKLCNAILNKTKGGTTTQLIRHRDTYCPNVE